MKHLPLIVIRSLLVVVLLTIHFDTYAKLHVTIISQQKTVETLMNVMKTIDTSYYGKGPAMIQIDYIDELSCKYCVYESLGCSEFNVTQTDSTLCMAIYSMLGYIWGTDCCQEDYPRTMPMLYCLANPVNLTDPSGCSTNVVQNPDGAYKVIGGDLSDRYGHNWGLNRIKQHMRNSVPNVFPYSLYRR